MAASKKNYWMESLWVQACERLRSKKKFVGNVPNSLCTQQHVELTLSYLYDAIPIQMPLNATGIFMLVFLIDGNFSLTFVLEEKLRAFNRQQRRKRNSHDIISSAIAYFIFHSSYPRFCLWQLTCLIFSIIYVFYGWLSWKMFIPRILLSRMFFLRFSRVRTEIIN